MNKNKKILITGASGFIGTNLLYSLLKQNLDIAVIDRHDNLMFDNVKKYIGDICDYSFLEKAIIDFQPNKVFHLAAYKNRSSAVEDMSKALKVNLIGTLNIYQALLNVPALESIVTLGTTDEYGEINPPFNEGLTEMPSSNYGFSKFCVTKLSEFFNRNFKLPIVVLRPTIAYGPHQGQDMFIPSLIKTLLNDNKYEMTPGDQIRDFIYISDLIEAIITVSNNISYLGQIFNIGSGSPIMIKEVAISIAKQLDKEQLLSIGAISYRDREVMNYNISMDKIFKNSEWKPKVSLEKGLNQTIKYYQNFE